MRDLMGLTSKSILPRVVLTKRLDQGYALLAEANASMRGTEREEAVLGLFIDRIDDSYQNRLMAELTDSAREAGVSLICFCAGPGRLPTGVISTRPTSYSLATPDTVDALIVSTPTVSSALGWSELESQLARFGDIPIISIGAEVEGAASVLLDNREATRLVVEHLLQEHGCQRLAFVRGPLANQEAMARLDGYFEALERAGIEKIPELVVEGNFLPEAGRNAVRVLVDERRADFDALVASNDEMALAALEALDERGIVVPDQVKVVGFDDSMAARYSLPSLTTVGQPLDRVATTAVQLALTSLGIDTSARRVVVPTPLVVRRSCGCPLETEQFVVASPQRPERGQPTEPLIQKRPLVAEAMTKAAPRVMNDEIAEHLLDGFFAGLTEKSRTSFAEAWDEVICDRLDENVDLRDFQLVTTALRQTAVPALLEMPGMLLRAETMLHEARVLLANRMQQQVVQQELKARSLMHGLSDVAQSLILGTSVASLATAVARRLADLRINSCCLAIRDTLEGDPADERLRVVLWYRDGEQVQLSPNSELFPPAQLVDSQFLKLSDTRSFVVVPLCFGVKTLGVGIYEAGSPDGAVYEALSAEFSAALEAVVEREENAERQAHQERLIDEVTSAWNELDKSSFGKEAGRLDDAMQRLIRTRQQLETIRVHDDEPVSASPETVRETPKKPSVG